jgi:DNA end-binding protein Ku
MPRASWRGYLRLSLVSCPIYLSPATARTKPIRLHQVWRGAPDEGGGELEDQVGGQDVSKRPASGLTPDYVEDRAEPTRPATRITLRPHDPSTGEEVEKEEVVRGYEYKRGRYITFTPDELKALDLESSKIIDLEMFVPRGEVDPVYFNSPYYLYPDGPMAAEAIRVIGAAMADAGVAGIGRLTMSRRERMVVVDPRGSGMVLITLRAAEEVRVPQFTKSDGAVDAEMLAIARAIIGQRAGKFDPSRFRDRYQESLRELIEAKMKGLPIKPREVSTPAPVIDLMAALKLSLVQEPPTTKGAKTKKRAQAAPDRRQRALLLPVSGSRKKKEERATEPATVATRGRKKA